MIIFKESIEPTDALSTILIWFVFSLDSNKNSLPEYGLLTLYGNVFLIKDELLKSKLWSKLLITSFDLKVSPIKYGNSGANLFKVVSVVTPTWYA